VSNSTRRLERVKTIVTATQVVLLWMEEVQQFYALRDYVVSLKGKPDGAYPLVRLPAQARAAVHQELKGQAQDAVRRAADSAERDAIFLFHLFMNTNRNLLEERKANWLQAGLLNATLRPGKAGKAPTFGRRPWGDAASAFLVEVYAHTSAVHYIAKRYFQGRSPLFPQTAEDLHDLVEHTEQLVDIYNDGLFALNAAGEVVPTPELGVPIEVAAVKKRSVEPAIALVEQTVRLAKAETLVDLGDRRAAAQLIQEHL
jgi:hypothetical protein